MVELKIVGIALLFSVVAIIIFTVVCHKKTGYSPINGDGYPFLLIFLIMSIGMQGQGGSIKIWEMWGCAFAAIFIVGFLGVFAGGVLGEGGSLNPQKGHPLLFIMLVNFIFTFPVTVVDAYGLSGAALLIVGVAAMFSAWRMLSRRFKCLRFRKKGFLEFWATYVYF